jgi:hypothetical protein
MSTARINLIRDTDETFIIDIVDENGQPYDATELVGAEVEFLLREAPTDIVDVIKWTTTLDPDSLVLLGNTISLIFVAADTTALDIKVYYFQVTITLADSTVLPPIIEWSPFDLNLGGTAAPEPPVFTNTVQLDEDYGATDALRYMTPGGSPIENAQIRVYYKSDYDAGTLDTPVGVSKTNAFGRWNNPVLVTPGFTYTVQFFKPNDFGPDTTEVVA